MNVIAFALATIVCVFTVAIGASTRRAGSAVVAGVTSILFGLVASHVLIDAWRIGALLLVGCGVASVTRGIFLGWTAGREESG
jgi:hypothetical protein